MLSWLAGAKPWRLTKAVSINKPHYFLCLSCFCVGLLGCFGWGGYVCLAFSDVSRISSATVQDVKVYLVRDKIYLYGHI